MSDDVEFQILTQSLAQKNFGGRVVAADRVKARLIGCRRLSRSADIGGAHGAHEHGVTPDLAGCRGRDRHRGGPGGAPRVQERGPVGTRRSGTGSRLDSNQPGHPGMSTGCAGLAATC